MGRAGYDFQSPDNEKPRLERGTEPCPRKSYSSTRPCSRASSTPWCARRSGGRKAYRAGHYDRSLTAKAGRLELKVPKLKGALFESAVIERYRRRGESVEEALIGMYPAGVVHQAGRRHRPVAVGRPHAVPDIERQAQARVRRDRRVAPERLRTTTYPHMHLYIIPLFSIKKTPNT